MTKKKIMYTICDLIAPPDILKQYMVKDNNFTDGCPYNFDLNKVVKNTQSKRVATIAWALRNWGAQENVSHAGYNPGSDSVSFWSHSKCPDLAIKKIFLDNPKVPIKFYWFNENDERTHYYIRDEHGKMKIQYGEGALKK